MTLTGTVTGPNQDALFEKAIKEARTYYGKDCVSVELSNETTNHIGRYLDGTPVRTEYQADYEATLGLHFQGTSAPNCDTCGAEQ